MSENAAIDFVENMMLHKSMSRDSIAKLMKKLNSSKIFVNMIIHDFRNPTISQQAGNMQLLQKVDEICENQKV